MGPQAHKLHHRRTTVKRLRRNYEDLPKFSGKSIEKTAGLNYTRHIRIFAAAGCWQNIQILDAASQAALGRENRIERLVQGIGGSGLADPAGPEHASAAGAMPGGVLVGRGTLELAGMVVPAGGAAGAGGGSAKFLGVLQRAPGPLQKEKITGWASTPTSNVEGFL